MIVLQGNEKIQYPKNIHTQLPIKSAQLKIAVLWSLTGKIINQSRQKIIRLLVKCKEN